MGSAGPPGERPRRSSPTERADREPRTVGVRPWGRVHVHGAKQPAQVHGTKQPAQVPMERRGRMFRGARHPRDLAPKPRGCRRHARSRARARGWARRGRARGEGGERAPERASARRARRRRVAPSRSRRARPQTFATGSTAAAPTPAASSGLRPWPSWSHITCPSSVAGPSCPGDGGPTGSVTRIVTEADRRAGGRARAAEPPRSAARDAAPPRRRRTPARRAPARPWRWIHPAAEAT